LVAKLLSNSTVSKSKKSNAVHVADGVVAALESFECFNGEYPNFDVATVMSDSEALVSELTGMGFSTDQFDLFAQLPIGKGPFKTANDLVLVLDGERRMPHKTYYETYPRRRSVPRPHYDSSQPDHDRWYGGGLDMQINKLGIDPSAEQVRRPHIRAAIMSSDYRLDRFVHGRGVPHDNRSPYASVTTHRSMLEQLKQETSRHSPDIDFASINLATLLLLVQQRRLMNLPLPVGGQKQAHHSYYGLARERTYRTSGIQNERGEGEA
jgi:hypothetical protein